MSEPAIVLGIDARRFGGFASARTVAVRYAVPCAQCGKRTRRNCGQCHGSGFMPRTSRLMLPSMQNHEVGHWLAAKDSPPDDGDAPGRPIHVVLTAAVPRYSFIVDVTASNLERGGKAEVWVPIDSLPCPECMGLCCYELSPSVFAVPSADAEPDGTPAWIVPEHPKLSGTWCDRCQGSASIRFDKPVLTVDVPAGTKLEQRLRITNAVVSGDLTIGDVWVGFKLKGRTRMPRTENPSEPLPDRAPGSPASKPTRGHVDLESIVLDDDVKRRLERALAMFIAGDPAMPQGLLLTGPPGTGKTLLGKSIAKATQCEFIATSLSDLKGAYLGHSAKQVNEVWERARKASRAIIFVDECEGAFPRRGSESADVLSTELVQTFLAAWDGFSSSRTVWVIGATNRPAEIDEAIISRFGEIVPIGLPGPGARREILGREFKKMLVELPIDEKLVDDTIGLSGRDLATLARAVRQETYPDAPTTESLYVVLARLRKRASASVDATATWESLVLAAETKVQLQGLCAALKDAQRLQARNIPIPTTLLLDGPPGTGKTQIAKTIANESGLQFLEATTASLKAGHVGQSGQRVRELFERARSNAPCIVFLDELDVLAKERGSDSVDAFQTEILGQLLQEIDGVKENAQHLLVIAATNHAANLDSAIASRFGLKITIALPNAAQRAELLAKLLAPLPCHFDSLACATRIADDLEGVSGRDLKSLVSLASQRAFSRTFAAGSGSEVVLREDDLDAEVAATRKQRSTVVDAGATWQRLVIGSETREELQTICVMLKNATSLEARGFAIPSGLLLYGPSGTGKTQIARTLANEGGLQFLGATTADLKAEFVGQSGQRVAALFARARASAPCILFLDELDGVAGQRGGTDSFAAEIVGQLLQELDGIKASASHVFVVAATNRPDALDSAILSRFASKIEIGLPDEAQRATLLGLMLDHVQIAFDREAICAKLAGQLEGSSGRDLKSFVELAERRAIARAMGAGAIESAAVEERDFIMPKRGPQQ